MYTKSLVVALLADCALAFPLVSTIAGVDSSLFANTERYVKRQQGGPSTCPFNPVHPGAAPYTTQYPYCGAKNGQPGKQSCPNNLVPAKGDKAHAYTPPGKNDIRGPCPGLNAAANHNFLSHDGITTFNELVDMQQNVYGVGYDLAVLLAVLGTELDGDLASQRLSIGCDATNRTSSVPGQQAGQLGLDGHNKFEGDTSLTRNDYFLANGDNFRFNATLYKMMSQTAAGNFSRSQMAKYRAQRYNQSRAQNGNFYYGPRSLLLYGAASFLYELFPSLGDKGKADQTTQNYFFIPEALPPNWYSRATPYTIPLVAKEIYYQYQQYPVAFGGNTGGPNTFVGIGEYGPYFSNSKFNGTAQGVACLLYQLATENVPASISGLSSLTDSQLRFAAGKLNPIFATTPCPLNYNNPS